VSTHNGQDPELHEGVDTSTPNGRLIFGIFATIAEFERELIRDRVRSGIASARAKGKRLGRPRANFDVGKAQKLRAEGHAWRQISKQLRAPPAHLRKPLRVQLLLQACLGVDPVGWECKFKRTIHAHAP
jgi:DNA invertase Pin-like site-specific DNA recombinase